MTEHVFPCKILAEKAITSDFSKTGVFLDQIPDLAQDRPRWQAFTNRLKLAHANERGD